MQEMSNKYYRIVYFDKKGAFRRLQIKPQCEVDIDNLISQNPYPAMMVYRCNAKGNNYSGRLVYPSMSFK